MTAVSIPISLRGLLTLTRSLLPIGRRRQGHHPRQEHQGSQGPQGQPTIQEGLRLSNELPCLVQIGICRNQPT